MHDYNLVLGLAIHAKFYDLDLILGSQGCQIHKLQIGFRFLSTVVKWCMVATHFKKNKHSMFCVTSVYLRNITNMIFIILHLNVSHLSVCSSLFKTQIHTQKNNNNKSPKIAVSVEIAQGRLYAVVAI